MTTEHTCMTASEAAIAALPEKTQMTFIDRGDELTEDQIGWFIEGNYDKLFESWECWEPDQRWQHAEQYLMDACGVSGYYSAGIYEIPDDDDPAHVWHRAVMDETWGFEEFRAECDERDDSDPLSALCSATSNPMIRYNVGHYVECLSWDGIEVVETMQGIADALGILLHDSRNRLALEALVVNASYGGTLCILHRTDFDDIVTIRDGGTVVFTDPEVLVYDGWNGSGHQETIKGTITVQVDEDTMQHDAGRMSWSDDIAGIVHSCADTPATFTPKEKVHHE